MLSAVNPSRSQNKQNTKHTSPTKWNKIITTHIRVQLAVKVVRTFVSAVIPLLMDFFCPLYSALFWCTVPRCILRC